jgi:hypothetical protein
MVHEVPPQVNAGNIVLAPIAFPWVLDVAAISDIRTLAVVPWKSFRLVIVYVPP